MKKLVSLLLVVVMVLSVFTVVPFTANAVENQTGTESGELFVRIDGKEYYVEKGEIYTYQFCVSVPNVKVSSIDCKTTYDTEGLDFIPYLDDEGEEDIVKHFPSIYAGVVNNFAIDGVIYYNFSNYKGIKLAENAVVFEGQFKVTADRGTYDITTSIQTLSDIDMNKIVYGGVKLGEYTQSNGFSAEEVPTESTVKPSDSPTVEPTEEQTDLPTEEPTFEPTEVPSELPTDEPTIEPTEEKTEAPTDIPTQEQTRPINDKVILVVDGFVYEVEKGDIVTYQFTVNLPDVKASSIDVETFYDTDGLSFVPFLDDEGEEDLLKHFPKISSGVVNNFNIDGEIYYNYSNYKGIKFENAIIFEGQFEVTADSGMFYITTRIKTLADIDMNKIVYNYEKISEYQSTSSLPDLDYVATEVPTEKPTTISTDKPTQKPTQTPSSNPIPGPSPLPKKTVFFQNNWMWSDVHVYYWGSSYENSAAWPGNPIQVCAKDGMFDIYMLTVPSDISGIIFNGYDSELGYRVQSIDISNVEHNHCYYMLWDEEYGINSVGVQHIYDIFPQPTPTAKPTEKPPVEPTEDAENELFIRIDGVKYAVNKGDTYKYRFCVSVPDVKISGMDCLTTYDTEGLEFVPYINEDGEEDLYKHFPNIAAWVINNFKTDGNIYYNFSHYKGVRLENNEVVFEGQFKVTADSGIYDIATVIKTMADTDMNKIVYNYEKLGDYAESHEFSVNHIINPSETEPTEEPTSVPGDELYVNIDGTVYKVEKGDVVTYQYIVSVPGVKISSFDAQTFYDTEGLTILPYYTADDEIDETKHFPQFVGPINNFKEDGIVYYNYSNYKGVKLENAVVFECQFEVTADSGIYEINTKLKTLADTDMNKIVYNYEKLSDFTEKSELIGYVAPTIPSEYPGDPGEGEGLYIRVNDNYYEVEQGEEYIFTYYLQVEDKKVGTLDARVEYDADGLQFVPTLDENNNIDYSAMFPILRNVVFNCKQEGRLLFNYLSLTGVEFASQDSVLFTCKFKVTAAQGVYDINPYIYCLADENVDIIVDEGVVYGEFNDNGIIVPEYVIGDVNRDGKVNIFDATLIQCYVAQMVTLDDEQLKLADARGDGRVNIFDATMIMQYLAGYITEF